jgi:hypothetical protein
LEFFGPGVDELLGFHVEIGEEVFLWESGQDASAVICEELVMEELEVVEAAAHLGARPRVFLLAAEDAVEFVAGQQALLDELGPQELDLPPLEEVLVLPLFLPAQALLWLHALLHPLDVSAGAHVPLEGGFAGRR